MTDKRTRGLAVALVVVCSAAVAGAAVAGTVAGDHGSENGNYTVNLPFDSDHYPGGVNEENASINHYAAGTQDVFADAGAPDGLSAIKWIIVSSDDVDFSACKTENTAAFGIDRGNNDSGTSTDDNLLDYRKDSQFRPNGIYIEFYQGEEIAAPSDAPIHLNPEDEVVAHQGYKSGGGPCYTMPSDPGWYQIDGFINGTARGSGEHAAFDIPSHYFYICECDSEKEAYATLGPPPGQENPYADGDGSDSEATSTPTPEDAATATPEPVDAETATPESADTPTPASATDTPGRATQTATDAPDRGGGDGGGGDGGDARRTDAGTAEQRRAGPGPASTPVRANRQIPVTPTVAEGPGFGAGLAMAALVGAALLAARRNR